MEHEDPTTVVNESLGDHEVKLFVTIYTKLTKILLDVLP